MDQYFIIPFRLPFLSDLDTIYKQTKLANGTYLTNPTKTTLYDAGKFTLCLRRMELILNQFGY